MNRRLLFLSIIIVSTIIICGCRSSKPTAEPTTVTETKCRCGYQWLEATFNSEVRGVNVSGILRTSCDSVIWVSISKVVELGRMKLTPDSVTIYAKVLNKAYRGTYDDIYRITNYRTSYEEIQQKIYNAYRRNEKQIVYDVDARQLKETIVLDLRRMTPSSTALHYPMNIPDKTRWLKK